MATSKMGDKNVTLMQDNFATSYIETGGDALQAALIAGYSEKSAATSAYNNLHNDDVLALIEERRKKAEKALGISPYYCAQILKKWADSENGFLAIRAVVELGKMFGYYASVQVDIKQNGHAEFVRMLEENKTYDQDGSQVK